MTCIVGMVTPDSIVIGGDSLGVAGLDATLRKDVKVFQVGEFLIGFTSSFRMGQLLRFNLSVPLQHPGTDDYGYMVTVFIESVRTCLKNGGFAQRQNEEESGGSFLVGYNGRLYHIDGDYQVGEGILPYEAIGCGEGFAKGAMAILMESDLPPMAKVDKALRVAERHSVGVRGPFEIVELLNGKESKGTASRRG